MLQGIFMIFLSVCALEAKHISPKCPNQGFIKFPDPKNHQQYFFCSNGILKLEVCDHNMVFDLEKSDCINPKRNMAEHRYYSRIEDSKSNKYFHEVKENNLDSNKQGASFKCPDKATKNYPDLDDCRKYYHCDDGSYVINECPKLFLFDVITSSCQLFSIAQCYNYTTTTTTPKPVICPPKVVQDVPYPGNCHKYYHCDNGIKILKSCSLLHLFDEDTSKCRMFFLANCKKITNAKSYFQNIYVKHH